MSRAEDVIADAGWCLGRQMHAGCQYGPCTCECHQGAK